MSIFDKGMSQSKRESLELAEASRESVWTYPSFMLELFQGRLNPGLIHPFPQQDEKDKAEGDRFMAKLESFLKSNLDPDEVDKTSEIPPKVMEGLAEMGAFAMKIPKEYGGLGLSQLNYNRTMHLLASYCGSTTVLLSAHQSIGVPQPLKLFGTEEQKRKYFPRFRKGDVSAFALTEVEAGSDPRSMKTTAAPTEDGKYFLINGEKLWCTNGNIAKVIVVMAVTPPKIKHGKEVKQITAFIVETDTPGFEVAYRCSFMGLHGIKNGILRFNNVRVPRENIILGEGEGLKLALVTLNTGRLTVPAAVTGMSKWCLHVARKWSKKRVQWGLPIGEHETIASKLAWMSSTVFAMDAVWRLTSQMADDKHKDIRLEAAVAKLFGTEESWKIADMTVQIRGGRGYETGPSLKGRGEIGWAVERVLRDARINLVIEGTSEIMHLFIAREALDPHLKRINILLGSRSSLFQKITAFLSCIVEYPVWYLSLWMPPVLGRGYSDFPPVLKSHMNYIRWNAKKLARSIFHQMLRYQKKLESKQNILNRFVDIGTDLFAMAAAASYAASLYKAGNKEALDLADLFCRQAGTRVERHFQDVKCNNDKLCAKVAKQFEHDTYRWLEEGIMKEEN